MRKNTVITLGASFVFGVLAVALARGWINDAIESEYNKSAVSSAVSQSLDAKMVPVLVMDGDQSFGDRLTPDLVRVESVPEDMVPLGAYASKEALFLQDGAQTIVLTRLLRNEVILPHKISGPGAKGSLSALISAGKRAFAVRINDVAGVAGYITPGDHVDVLYVRDQDSRRNGNNLISDVLLQNIKVLGVDQNMDKMSAAPDVGKTVTLEVTGAEAQKLQLAMDAGKINMSLRSLGDVEETQTSTIRQSQLVKRADKQALAPKKRVYKPKAKNPGPTDSIAKITVFRGEIEDQVNVIKEGETFSTATQGG